MPETATVGCDGQHKWMWYDLKKDLVNQGGLANEDVVIDPWTVSAHGCGGKYENEGFYLTWVKDKFLLLSMSKFSQALVDAFAKIVDYQPFCKYDEEDGLTTEEWDKIDTEARMSELRSKCGISNLTEIKKA